MSQYQFVTPLSISTIQEGNFNNGINVHRIRWMYREHLLVTFQGQGFTLTPKVAKLCLLSNSELPEGSLKSFGRNSTSWRYYAVYVAKPV